MDSYAHTETTLQDRIDAHEKYARYEINDWIKAQVKLKPGERVLDIGCGNGKQALMYAREVSPGGYVNGLDISFNLVMEAAKNAYINNLDDVVSFEQDNANNSLPFRNEIFDLVSCCFSIYYLDDIQKTLSGIKRVLKPGGRLFVAAPTQNNAIEMRRLVEDTIGIKTSDAYTKRTTDVIIPMFEREFKNMNIGIFRNPMNFPTTDVFMDYFKSALISKSVHEAYYAQIMKVVDVSVKTIGFFQITKEVYGILGFK